MKFEELAEEQGKEVAAMMYAILLSEPAHKLAEDLLDYMGPSLRSSWAAHIRIKMKEKN